jgi:exopolysaccharide biosynthesis polyprenyl glycosylphosphotransferase
MPPQQAAIDLRDTEPSETVAPQPPRLSIAPASGAATADVTPLPLDASSPEALESNEPVHPRLLAVADVTAISAAFFAALSGFALDAGAVVAVASVPLVLFLFAIAGLYSRDELRLKHTTLDEAPLLLQLTGLCVLGVAIVHPPLAAGTLTGAHVALLWMALFAAVLGGRVLARSVAQRIVPVERCVIIGDDRDADRIRQRIATSQARTTVVDSVQGADLSGLGGPEGFLRRMRDLGVHRIIIAPNVTGTDGDLELIRLAKAIGFRVSVLPRILGAVGSAVAFDEVEGMAMLGVPRFGLGRSSRFLKRAFDVAATTVGLLLLSPVLTAIALAIRLDSKGPIFFRQVRVGRHSQHFFMVKFRSMVADADARKGEISSLNVAGAGLFKAKDDPRVTRVGHFLRRSSLDELPQLFNVLRGEMSLVGPRPLVTDEDAQILGLDRSRLRFKPGMTGPWQLLGSRVSLQEMVEIDYLYASNWSLWLDLKILLRTVRYVVRRGNL